jgi:glycosyltransferase involved in cell wall biosynthesis
VTITIGLSHGYRSSGGGVGVNAGLLAGLEAQADCRVVPFDPGTGAPDGCDVIVCTGTSVVRAEGARTVLWPLNVAPLEPETVRLASVSLKAALRYRLLPLKIGRAIRMADGLVFGSRYAAELHRARFKRAASLPLTVVRTGSPSLPLSPPQDSIPEAGRVLMVAHLYPYKRVVEAIQAVDLLRGHHPGLSLRIAGKPAEPSYAAEVAAAAARVPGVELLGNLTREALIDEYRRADIALLTSVSENAGSFHMFDAALFGIPLVSSQRSSLGEVLAGVAEFVDPMAPKDIARGLDAVLSDGAYRSELAERSRTFASTAPSWDERAADLVTFCRSLS